MPKTIQFYRSSEIPYGVFSNFDRKHPIALDNLVWPSTEHYFQAMKMVDPKIRELIRLSKTPAEAAVLGRNRQYEISPWWETVKVGVMLDALRAKFTQYSDLKALLISTNDAILVEHTKNDFYWGDGGDGSGKNMLGNCLMALRVELNINK